MALVLTAAPAAEPISVAEAKAHLRIDTDDEDTLLAALIGSARAFIERNLSLALISQGWSYYLDAWPCSRTVSLPLGPVRAVTAIRRYGTDDVATEIDPGSYTVDVLSERARIILPANAGQAQATRRLNGLEVAFTAGYGDEAVTCSAKFVPVSGYRPDSSSLAYLKNRSRITIAFAPLGKTGIYAPVYATVGTKIGTVTVTARRSTD